MIRLMTILLLVLGINASAFSKTIELTETNLVSLNDEVSSETISKTIFALVNSTSPTIYLFINSPGGSVIAGIQLVTYLQNTKKNIVCVVQYAASMAHAILESCPKRVGTPTNILLQHKASTQAEGSVSEVTGQLKVLTGLELFLNEMEAKRVGKSLAEFSRLTTLPWVTFGEESINENLLDEIATVTCTEALYKKVTTEEGRTMLGAATRTTSACPLIAPIIQLENH